MMNKYPTRVIEYAVRRMLPKNRIGREMYKKLKVYQGDSHPHKAQVASSGVHEEGEQNT
jgi:large subunit ribosomal protein L13